MIRRRIFAAILLYGFAIGSVLYWNDGEWDWPMIAINLVAASAGMIFLHTKWAARERTALTPKKVKDIFS